MDYLLGDGGNLSLDLVEVVLEAVWPKAAVLDPRLGPRDPELDLLHVNLR